MKLKKSEKILLTVLALSVAFYVLDTFVLSGDKEKPSSSSKGVASKKMQEVKTEKAELDIQSLLKPKERSAGTLNIPKELLINWMRDPFLGAYTQELLDSLRVVPPEEYVLKAISWRDSIAYVIINDDVYKQGEPKNGLLVLDVTGDTVVFTVKGKKKMIKFGG